jgi:pyruvate ferredoxin oxidoreductase beta subunit
MAIQYGRLAVQTGMFPLYEVTNGLYHITYGSEPLKPVTDYLKGQGRFRHLGEADVERIQERVTAEWENLKFQCTVK